MAGVEEDSMDITLIFGQKKIPLHLELSSDDSVTVGQLADKVYKETNIEPACQKLIFKGKALFKNDDMNSLQEKLSSFGVCHGDRIMLLARKAIEKQCESSDNKMDSEQDGSNINDEIYRRLHDVEMEAEKQRLYCNNLVKESQNICHQEESSELQSYHKSFKVLHESFMKLLEKIDAIHANNNEEFRKLKKTIVSSLHVQLDLCEKIIGDLSKKLLNVRSKHKH